MGKISNQHILDQLTAQFEGQFTSPSEPFGLLTLETSTATINALLTYLKNDKELSFNYLTDITAVHYPELEKALCVVYHLHSLTNNVRIRVKVFVPVSNPTIPTATTLWEGANWMERETFDFYGIQFTGHPDLRRILLPDDWEGYPLRQDYKTAERYHQIKIDL